MSSTNVRSFSGTDVIVYADDVRAPAKQRRAIGLYEEHRRSGTGVVSIQVLQEYFAAATRKLHLDAALARRKLELLAQFNVAKPEVSDVLSAIDLHRLQGVSFWDALIIRMAKQSGCGVLFSEDLQHAGEVEGVRIINPFA